LTKKGREREERSKRWIDRIENNTKLDGMSNDDVREKTYRGINKDGPLNIDGSKRRRERSRRSNL